MNQTGVASTGCRRQALMNRVPASVSVHLEERAGETDEILEPERLEPQLGAELAKLVRHAVVEEIIAGDDRNRRVALLVERAEAPQEPQTVHERHAEIQDDRVRVVAFGLS